MMHKNRNRAEYTFANINLLGRCNADCYFCLGKDIEEILRGKNQLSVHFDEWENFSGFLEMCKAHNVRQLYVTGQTADGLQYCHLEDLVDDLQGMGFVVGVRTNGYLAEQKMHIIQKMRGGIGYSIHSLNPDTTQRIMGRKKIPVWGRIIPASGPNVRVSIVLNRHNINEFYDLCGYISKFKNVRYIQVRRISTDTRKEQLSEDIGLYEQFFEEFKKTHKQFGQFCLAPRFRLFGKEIVFWRTIETSANSLNYFTDGTCSDEYFVVEGYLKNRARLLNRGIDVC